MRRRMSIIGMAVFIVAAAVSSTGVASATGGDPTPFPPGYSRLAGADRYETAVAVSGRYSPGVPVAYVATGANFPDALSAAAVAASDGGPLLLTSPDALPSVVHAELSRLQPASIVVIGGFAAVSPSVERSLEGIAPTSRIAGDDRYATARSVVSSGFATAPTVFLATGASFPDALSATGAAGSISAPVLLIRGTDNTVDAETWAVLGGLKTRNVVLVGGPAVIALGVESELAEAGYLVTRLGGASRYETAAVVNDRFFAPGSVTTAFIATGNNFPDALAGAALAGRMRSPLYISPRDCTPETTHSSLERSGASTLITLGGAQAIGDDAAQNKGCLAWSTPVISGSFTVGSTLTASPGAWSAGTTFSYAWFFNGVLAAQGAIATLVIPENKAGMSISVQVTGTLPGHVSVSATSAAASISYPASTAPIDSWTCPWWAPIKGNRSSMIYHVPGGQFYDRTNPEECFTTEAAAIGAGYRRSLR